MLAKLAHVADPPDVVADAVSLGVGPRELLSGNILTQTNGLQHRTVAEAAAAQIIDLCDPGGLVKLEEGVNQVEAVNIIPDLFSLVAEDSVGGAGHHATHKIGQEPMQLAPRMVGAGQTAASET